MLSRCQNYFLTGILTIIPLMVTIYVVQLVFDILSGMGQPFVDNLSQGVSTFSERGAQIIDHPASRYFIAIVLVIILLTVVGWIATKVIGKRLISMFDNVMNRIPVVKTIYGSMKKLLHSLQQKPDSVQRVVLINFPDDKKKAIGFVTKTFVDRSTGEKMAVVFVPMSPNPTGGFLEILPISSLLNTDWTIDEAMTFIVSGGAVPPSNLENFRAGEGQTSPLLDKEDMQRVMDSQLHSSADEEEQEEGQKDDN